MSDLNFIYSWADLDVAFNTGFIAGKKEAERAAAQVLTALVLTNGDPLTASAEALMDAGSGYSLERTDSFDTRAIVYSVCQAQGAL